MVCAAWRGDRPCRFLDAQRITSLTAYLEALHEQGLATCDHTTLLLNCYTKLKDVAKLDAFIHRDEGRAGGGGGAGEGGGVGGWVWGGAKLDTFMHRDEGRAGGGGGSGEGGGVGVGVCAVAS